jgi:hypothetical protein
MMRRRRSTLWLSLALLLLGGGLIGPGLMLERATASAPQHSMRLKEMPPIPSSSASFIDTGETAPSEAPLVLDDAPQRLDLRGNEISRPVARYRVDDSGTVYEEHSPQTEVPRLKQPVM